MPARIVLGLFASRGIALDAYHRLKTEGVAENAISLNVLNETAPLSSASESEMAMLALDPMVLGDVRKNYAQFIHNGETAVFVHAATDEDAAFAADVLRLYEPLAIDVLEPARPKAT